VIDVDHVDMIADCAEFRRRARHHAGRGSKEQGFVAPPRQLGFTGQSATPTWCNGPTTTWIWRTAPAGRSSRRRRYLVFLNLGYALRSRVGTGYSAVGRRQRTAKARRGSPQDQPQLNFSLPDFKRRPSKAQGLSGLTMPAAIPSTRFSKALLEFGIVAGGQKFAGLSSLPPKCRPGLRPRRACPSPNLLLGSNDGTRARTKRWERKAIRRQCCRA